MNRTCLSKVKGTKPLPVSCAAHVGEGQNPDPKSMRSALNETSPTRHVIGRWKHNSTRRRDGRQTTSRGPDICMAGAQFRQ